MLSGHLKVLDIKHGPTEMLKINPKLMFLYTYYILPLTKVVFRPDLHYIAALEINIYVPALTNIQRHL